MERREFLNLLAAGVVTAAGAAIAATVVPRFLAESPAPLPTNHALGVLPTEVVCVA